MLSSLSRVATSTSRAVAARQFSHQTWAAGFPRQKIHKAEKFVLGVSMISCIVAFPLWVMFHLDDYRQGKSFFRSK